MSLNLINDPWIPVICADGQSRVIAPWQIADPEILRPDWPRPDLNIACLELLIGLVYLADPHRNLQDWRDRRPPDPARLQQKLTAFAPAFDLLGDGPRFLQELGPLDGKPTPVDMLFIDSAGASTAKQNSDLMVHRDRYTVLSLPLAAMALYTLQAFAPSGGAGNRTSMRGGGPMVTLVDPGQGLWSLVWANTPFGAPSAMTDLPWMRPTRVSDKHLQTLPPAGQPFGVEAFFGMPRRLRLNGDDRGITEVIQKPWGTNYALWQHPLSPYYRQKPGAELLPKHPKSGAVGYRNWIGVVVRNQHDDLTQLALSLRNWNDRGGDVAVIVAGWDMSNMKPLDFVLSVQPWHKMSIEAEDKLVGMILAANIAGLLLRGALTPVIAEGASREAEREAFFIATEDRFVAHLQAVKSGADPCADWLADLRRQALRQFEALAMPGLDQRESDQIKAIVNARKHLVTAFAGYGKQGAAMFDHLELPPPVAKKKKETA